MSFDTKVEGITERSQVILDNFFGQALPKRVANVIDDTFVKRVDSEDPKMPVDVEAFYVNGNSNYIKSYRYMVNCASVAFAFAIVQSAME